MNPEKKAAKAVEKLTDHETVVWNALMLASAGVYVFPVLLTDPHLKPEGGVKATKRYPVKWGSEASIEADAVADMFERNPTAAVGIATGPSRLVAIDLDHGEKNGAESLTLAGLDITPTPFSYPTLGGGTHHVYRSPKKRYAKTLSDKVYGDMKLLGVDVRATGGMLVYYGPKIETKPDLDALPKAPEWALEDAAPTGTKAEPSIAMSDWLSALHGGKPTLKTREAVKAVKRDGMGHGDLLVVTNKLAELGASGAAGVADAVAEARERYVGNWGPLYEKAWDNAMLDAAQYYGKPLPIIALVPKSQVAKEAKAAKPKKGKAEVVTPPGAVVEVVDDIPERPHTVPDDFFEKVTGLQSQRLADLVNYDGTIGAGNDGTAWHYLRGVWRPDDEVIKRRTAEMLGDRYRRDHAGIARDMILANAEVTRLTGAPHFEFVNLANGMVNWRTGDLLAHHPDYLSTVQLPVELVKTPRHPRFDRWLAEVAPETMHVVIWELIAYTILNGNPFQKAAMLHGPGGTGKGTLIRLLEHIAGAANTVHLTPTDMTGTFEPARMFGKLLNTVGDLDGKYLPDTGPFKRVTGGDSMMAQHKNKAPFEYSPWIFPVFAANTVAVSSDATSGFFRRWLILPFTRVVDRSQPYDERALWAEASDIASTAIGLLPALVEQNDFTETIETIEATADFQTQSDIIRTWLDDDEHVMIHDPSARQFQTSRAHLYQVYADWSLATGHRNPLSRIAFSKRLTALGHEFSKVKGTVFVRGVKTDSVPLTVLGGTLAEEA